jgi:hypothetical protein
MRRFIKKKQSPRCHVEIAEVTKHFRETWSNPLKDVIEAKQSSIFRMEPQLTEKNKEEEKKEEFMLDQKNIAEIIESREDLAASGIDGISSRIMNGAEAE